MTDEILVFVAKGTGIEAQASAALRGARLSCGEQLFVLAGPPPPGVTLVDRADRLAAIAPRLTPAELLFARAWLSGRAETPRTGEGADWDTPGYEAP